MRKILIAVVALLCGVAYAAAQDESDHWQPLYDVVDPKLQALLEQKLISNAAWRRLVERKKLAVGVVDLGGPGEQPRFARINGNQMMYAASLPKIAILLAAYASFEDGSLAETPAVHEDLSNMIRVSSNQSATRVMDMIGMKKIESVMRDPQFGFYDEASGGGLWVGKRYASSGPRNGDPLFNRDAGGPVLLPARKRSLDQRRKIGADARRSCRPWYPSQVRRRARSPRAACSDFSQIGDLAELALRFGARPRAKLAQLYSGRARREPKRRNDSARLVASRRNRVASVMPTGDD